MANCNRKLLRVTVSPDAWSAPKHNEDVALCSDIWFSAKNIYDIELFNDLLVVDFRKLLFDVDLISDLSRLHTTKKFSDLLNSPLDSDIVIFQKRHNDDQQYNDFSWFITSKVLHSEEYFNDSVLFNFNNSINDNVPYWDNLSRLFTRVLADQQNHLSHTHYSFNKPIINLEPIDDFAYIHSNKTLYDVHFQTDTKLFNFTKTLNLHANNDYFSNNYDYLYEGYLENSASFYFFRDNLTFITNYVYNDSSEAISGVSVNVNKIENSSAYFVEGIKIKSNKYISNDTSSIGESCNLYYNEYLDYSYFSDIYAGEFIQNLI